MRLFRAWPPANRRALLLRGPGNPSPSEPSIADGSPLCRLFHAAVVAAMEEMHIAV